VKFNLAKSALEARKTLSYYVGGISRRADEHHAFLLASGLSFSVFICIIPFVLIIFAVLGRVVESASVQAQVNNYIETIIPYPEYADFAKAFISQRIGEFSAYKGLAGYLGGAGLLIAASGLFSSMKTALNRAYGVIPDDHFFISQLKDISLVLVVTLFFLLSVVAFPALQALREFTPDPAMPGAGLIFFLRETLIIVVSLTAVFGVFYVLYRYIPSRVTDRHTAMVSALASTIMWEIARQVFGFYISNFATLQRVYGAYIFFVVLALWIYYSSLVFIIGAEIGQLSRLRGKSRWQKIREYFAGRKYAPHN